MTLSTSFIEDLNFLTSVNYNTHSLALKNSKVILSKKRSKVTNFFWHFIHIITFTLVPVNPSLNQVTRHILKQSVVLNVNAIIDEEEKKLISRSFRHLRFFIRNQSGNHLEKITSVYNAVQKIQPVNRSLKFLINKFYLSADWINQAKNTSVNIILKSLENELSEDPYDLAIDYLLERKENTNLIHQFFKSFLSNKVNVLDQLDFLDKTPIELIELLNLSNNNLFNIKLLPLLVQASPKFQLDALFTKTHIQESIIESLKVLIKDKTFDFNELKSLIELSIKENVFGKVLNKLISNDLNLFLWVVDVCSLKNTPFSESTLEKIASFLFKNYKEDQILSFLKKIPYSFLKNHLIVSLHVPSKNLMLEMILTLNEEDMTDYILHLKNQNIDSISINKLKEKFGDLIKKCEFDEP